VNWNAAPGFVIVKLELLKSNPVAELVTVPSIPPNGVTLTLFFIVGGSSDAPLLDTFVPETEYCHPVA
jgi:hypothetical protein